MLTRIRHHVPPVSTANPAFPTTYSRLALLIPHSPPRVAHLSCLQDKPAQAWSTRVHNFRRAFTRRGAARLEGVVRTREHNEHLRVTGVPVAAGRQHSKRLLA